MRVKLYYTVEEEDVLAEAAKMLQLSADQIQNIITLFTSAKEELGKTDEETPNITTVLETLDDLRKCLLEIDTRASEVGSIVSAYDDYRREQRQNSEPEPPALEEDQTQNDNFGTD